MKTLEKVISITVNAGESGQTSPLTSLPPGKIIAVAAFFRDYSDKNAGFVRASIKDSTGLEVSQMQSISNYRDREAGYLAGKKPLFIDGGSPVTVTIQSTEVFNQDFLIDFVFVYDTRANC